MPTGQPARPNGPRRKRLTRDINADTPQPADPATRERLHRPARKEDYTHDKLDAGDFIENVTGTFDDDIDLPRV